MADIIDPEERIEQLLSQAEVRIARIFRVSVQHLKDELDLNEVADLIEQGRFDELIEKLQATAAHMGTAAQIEFITAGQATAAFLTAADVGLVRFDVVNGRAIAAMQSQTLDTIRGFTADQRIAVHSALIDGMLSGANPVDQARNFRDYVGLTDTQAAAVRNYRRLLEKAGDSNLSRSEQAEALTRALRDARSDPSVEAAIRRGRPLPSSQIDNMVSRYAERYVKYRSVVIGRTQAMRAVNEGNEEAYNQAIDMGQLDAAQLSSKWSTKIDGRERESHQDLNGVVRPWGGTFPGRYGPLRYPGDPQAPAAEIVQCRCLLTRRIKPR